MSQALERLRHPADDPPELVAFAEYQQLKGLAPSTIAKRAQDLGRFAVWLDRPLSSATLADLRAFVASRRPHLAAATQVSEINVLQAFYAALFERGWVEDNPAQGLESWRVASTRQPLGLLSVRALLLEASRAQREGPFSAAVALRDRACFELLFATGVQASELCSARVVDLDLEQRSFWIRRAKCGPNRRVPLPAAAVAALRAYVEQARSVLLAEREEPGALFLTKTGAPLVGDALGSMVARVGERAGVKAYPHVFRRTLATELARCGVSLPVIQKLLGHASLAATQEYVVVSVEDLRAALGELDRRVPRCHPALSGGVQCRLFSGWELSAA